METAHDTENSTSTTPPPSPGFRKQVYTTAALVASAGLVLILCGIILRETITISVILNSVGALLLVSTALGLLQRHFTDEVRLKEMEERLHKLLESRFDMLAACEQLGIHKMYAEDFNTFCASVLPERLKHLERKFVAVGVSLGGLGMASRGQLGEILKGSLDNEKNCTICTIKPASAASSYRQSELGKEDDYGAIVQASRGYFGQVCGPTSGHFLEIREFEDVVPKAALVSIDDEVIYFSPYSCASQCPTWFVIETRKDTPLFKKLKEDLDHYVGKASTPNCKDTASQGAK